MLHYPGPAASALANFRHEIGLFTKASGLFQVIETTPHDDVSKSADKRLNLRHNWR
jgi:hypothetical protein